MWKRNHSLPEQIERGLVMNENLFRPQFDTLKLSDKLWLMQTLATRYHLTFKELYAFSRWGQSCTTGLFEKGGREFVFVPGDTVILGWESFVQGMDKANQEELEDIFTEIEYEGTAEEFLRQGMAPVRQATIGPMFVGRKLEEIGWESVPMNDPRIIAHPDWLENLQKLAGRNSQSLEIHQTVRFERNGDSWRAWLCHPMTYPEFQRSLLWELAATLPTADEWAYLCGGGCRTLFPWGDGLDYAMHLHHFESEEDRGKPYDMEQPNFFGLSIAYAPYKRELIDGKTLTTCGGDGGCNICGGMGPLLGYLPCSPHCKPEVREDNEIHNDYDFFRPVIRVQTSGWRMGIARRREVILPDDRSNYENPYHFFSVTFVCGDVAIIGNGEFRASSGKVDGFILYADTLRYENGAKLSREEQEHLKRLYQHFVLDHEDFIDWDI